MPLLTRSVAGNPGQDLRARFALFFPSNRWFDVLQKVSTQLKTNLTSATKNRTDKVSGRWQVLVLEGALELSTSRVSCSKLSFED